MNNAAYSAAVVWQLSIKQQYSEAHVAKVPSATEVSQELSVRQLRAVLQL